MGIFLLNLGGPDSLKAIRPFLYNLFSDREIIKFGPSLLQKPIALLISSLRAKKTAEMYSLIGGKSPILDITAAQAQALEKALNDSSLNLQPSSLSFKVYTGMRYWHPFIKDTIEKILQDGIKHLIVLSLYPHYSKATTGSAIAELKRTIAKVYTPTRPSPVPKRVSAKGRSDKGEGKGGSAIDIQYIEQWYDFPPYIDALAGLVAEGISEFRESGFDILYSAHSLPESFIQEGDPYLEHIKKTITLLNERLSSNPYHITNFRWQLSFQSKSGPVKWLSPATEEVIIEKANAGIKNLFVVPISFVSDHIETLYEIDILYKELAVRHGINLKRCRSLNASEGFINALKELVLTKINQTVNLPSLDGRG
ncbi:MAG: ferrochelatase [Nitrospirae bacterium]|nr:ferrochelatase [Nitrospirota bacterium]